MSKTFLSNTTGGYYMSRFILVALMGVFSNAAFAAGNKTCTTTTTCVDEVPSDCGAANDELCTAATDVDGDKYWSDSLSKADCKDDDAAINPGATAVIGDGVDNTCNGEGDDKELFAAIEAAGGEASPKGIKLAAVIDSCVNSSLEGTETYVWIKKGKSSPWNCAGLQDGYSFERGKGVLNETQTHDLESERRIAGDRKAKAAAVAAVDVKIAELGHPASDSSPATGLYKALEDNLAAVETANGAAKEYLEAKAEEIRKEIGKAQGEILLLQEKVKALDKRIGVVESDVKVLKSTGVLVGVSLGGLILVDSDLLASENGPLVAGGTEGGGNLGFYVGGKNPHSQFLIEGMVNQGMTASDGGSVPATLFGVSGSLSYVANDLSVGGKLMVFGGSSGDSIAPQSSHLGASIGPTASWNPRIGHGMCSGVSAYLLGGVEKQGFNDFRTVSGVFVGGVSTNIGLCPK